MTSTLDLLQKVQKKSEERLKDFSEINQNGFDRLSKSTKLSLEESETEITTGIIESQTRIKTEITSSEEKQKKKIKGSTQSVITQIETAETEVTQALNSLRTLIRKFLGHWVAVAVSAFVIFALGMFVGVSLTKLISKPYQPTYQQVYDSRTKLTYLVPLKD